MATPVVRNIILGTSAAETLDGLNGSDDIRGADGDDIIRGGGGDDLLLGGRGNDQLFGGAGKDIMYGGKGDDFLNGNGQSDWLSGDEGADTLFGGQGADTFFFNGRTAGADSIDTITDFDAVEGDVLSFGKFAEGSVVTFEQDGANVLVFVSQSGFGPEALSQVGQGEQIATILDTTIADLTNLQSDGSASFGFMLV